MKASLPQLGLILMVSAFSAGCERPMGNEKQLSVKQRLHRSGREGWETRKSRALGIELGVPRDLCAFADAPELGMAIDLHTLDRPRNTLADKKCLLRLKIERLRKNDFEQRVKEWTMSTGDDAAENVRYWSWRSQRHVVVSRFDEDAHTYYRYDVECANGDIASTSTAVTNVYERGVSLYEKEDEAFVRRMLGSLRCGEPADRS